MDADLETVAHGGRVPAETAEAATIVLAGTSTVDGATAVTQVARRGGPPQPPFEPRRRKRSPWPWLLGIGAALALAILGYVLFSYIADRGSEPVAVMQLPSGEKRNVTLVAGKEAHVTFASEH